MTDTSRGWAGQGHCSMEEDEARGRRGFGSARDVQAETLLDLRNPRGMNCACDNGWYMDVYIV